MTVSEQPIRLSPGAPRNRRISVAAILATSFGALVFLSVAGVLAVTLTANYRNTFDLLGARAALLVDAMEDTLRTHLGRAQDAVEGLAEIYQRGDFEIDDPGSMKAALAGALVGAPSARGMFIYTENLISRGLVRVDGAPAGVFETVAPEPVTAPDIRKALEDRRRVGGARWGAFVTNEYGTFAYVSAPLLRNGIRRGWVIAPVELNTLSVLTRELSTRYATHAFILYGEDRVLADEGLTGGEAGSPKAKPMSALSEFGDPVLARFAERQRLDAFGSPERSKVQIAAINLDSEVATASGPEDNFIVLSRLLSGYGSEPWTLGAYYGGTEIGDEILRAWLSGAIGVGALVVAVIAAILLGRRLARPVREIADRALHVAAFDLDKVEPLQRSRVLELDEQAVAFNAMLTGLRAFSTYIPRSLVAKLVRTGESDAAVPRQAMVTVMFTDLAGFTTLSEQMDASAAASLLNAHFGMLCRAVDAEGGTVDKFMGDGMMAFFGAPDRLKGHAAAAVRAAACIRERLAESNAEARAAGGPELRLRIGIHTGEAIVGNIGAADRVNYTIVGDTVNVSQRLQDLGKRLTPAAETMIVISDETAARLDERFVLRDAGSHTLRGRGEPIRAHVLERIVDVRPVAMRA